MKRDAKVYIEDVQESISKIEEYTEAVSRDDFFSNTQVQDAVLRRLEIMGEAVRTFRTSSRTGIPRSHGRRSRG